MPRVLQLAGAWLPSQPPTSESLATASSGLTPQVGPLGRNKDCHYLDYAIPALCHCLPKSQQYGRVSFTPTGLP